MDYPPPAYKEGPQRGVRIVERERVESCEAIVEY